jgi:hypothetical protein
MSWFQFLRLDAHNLCRYHAMAVTEVEPAPQSPAPPEETELESFLDGPRGDRVYHVSVLERERAEAAADADALSSSPGGRVRPVRQAYGPNGEPLLLLASGVAAAAFGREREGREGDGTWAGGAGGRVSHSADAEMSEDGVVLASDDDGDDEEDEDEEEESEEEESEEESAPSAASSNSEESGYSDKVLARDRAAARRESWRRVSSVVSRVEITRNGQFTCPVGCGAVFLSPGPPEASLPNASNIFLTSAAAGAVQFGIGAELSSDLTAAAVGSWVAASLRHPSCAALDGIETLEALEVGLSLPGVRFGIHVPPLAAINWCFDCKIT